ncbi:MAG TPA: hypothetical protein VD947_01915 [Patescibacteria group bacterium]|nr:hypothetical protein [Patescibacteria group bacterium]
MVKTNIKKQLLSKIAALLGLLGLIFAGTVGTLFAQTVNQGYKSDQILQIGMLVKEKDDDSSKVEAVTQATLEKLKGVVVNKNDSPITLSSEGQSVFVANTGTVEVLVSDENGTIKSGDYLSISSLEGVAMKAKTGQSLVVGRASAGFDGSNKVGTTTNQSGDKTINLGRIPTGIAIAANPLQEKLEQNNIPRVLQNISSTVAGEKVSPARVWLAFIVFLASSILTGVMLYGGARSSLVALGRNPLSRTSIMRGLVQVILLSLIVFISGIFGVYLLLKL